MEEITEKIAEEYSKECDKLLQSYRDKIKEEVSNFLEVNYPKGSLITDHIGSGLIEGHRVQFYTKSIVFQLSFLVVNLTKRGTISKREPKRIIYFENIKK